LQNGKLIRRVFQTLALPRADRVKGNRVLLNILASALWAADAAFVVIREGED
jgi:hypothetical protein